jgi:hypothetical protein
MRTAALLAALGLALAGCGDDDDEEPAVPTVGQPPPTAEQAPPTEETEAETEATEAETEATEVETDETDAGPEPEPAEPEEREPPAPPEDQPGGAGDEEPARSLALLTGEGGQITPRTIRVPAFISIRVELRSADGRVYGLIFDGEAIRVAGAIGSKSITIDGLRPGEAIVGTPTGPGNRVRIEATAEPGP